MRLRGAALALATVVLVSSLLAPRPARAGTQDLVRSLDALVKGFQGGAGLWIGDPGVSQPLYAVHADDGVITASLYKLAILLEVESRVEAGTLSYADTITIEEEDVTDDGSDELPGTVMTVDAALEAMTTFSDNGSALAFWHTLGPENINATLVAQKIDAFHVARDDTEDNVATPRAIGAFFTLLVRGQLVSPSASRRMLARLERQKINDRLPDQLPEGTVVAHKTGNLAGLSHDAGVIFTRSGPRVVVAMTWDAAEEAAKEFIADVGSLVYGAILEPPTNARYVAPRVAGADAGAPTTVTIAVSNAGPRPWTAAGLEAYGLVWEIADAVKRPVARSDRPLQLGALEPGATIRVPLVLPAPSVVGDYTVTVGLADAAGRPLAAAGAATQSFRLRAHPPFLANAVVRMPAILHQGEASLLVVQYAPLPAAGTSGHPLALGYRFVDRAAGRQVASGQVALGTLDKGESGTFFAPIVAPALGGTYRVDYELRQRFFGTPLGPLAGQTASAVVTIEGARTYPGDETRVAPRIPTRPATAQPSPKLKLPTFPWLPSLLPKGKTPAPSPRP